MLRIVTPLTSMCCWWLLFFGIVTIRGDSRHFLGKNAALRKPTSQQPGDYFIYKSSKAVDGNTNNNVREGSCSHTSGGVNYPPTWTVNLGRQYYITGIRIYNAADTNRSLMRNFKVTGSEQTSSKRVIYQDEGTKFLDLIINITVDGTRPFQVVDISVPRGHYSYLVLCEVEIFTGCNPILSNGHYSPRQTFYESGIDVSITCSDGFDLIGAEQVRCVEGEWNGNSYCQSSCQLPNLDNGQYTHYGTGKMVSSKLPYGTLVAPRCNVGYTLVNAVRTRRCEAGGRLTGTDPMCIHQRCKLPDLKNGHYVNEYEDIMPIGALFLYNTTVWPDCNHGYRLVGNVTVPRRCGSNETWLGPEPTCQLIKCEWPVKFPNGQYVDVNERTGMVKGVGSNITARCLDSDGKNFELISLSEVRICQNDGQWSGEVASCVTMCRTPLVKDGVYRDTRALRDYYAEGQMIKLFCHTGYETTSQGSLTCTSNHTWEGKTGNCKVVSCPLKSIQYGHYDREVRQIEYFEVVNFYCDLGYKVIGPRARYCQANGTLSNIEPQCAKIYCPKHGPVHNGMVSSPTGDMLQYGSVVNISCSDGYFLGTGSRSRKCLWPGRWEGPEPVCKAYPLAARISNVVLICGCVIMVVCAALSVVTCVLDKTGRSMADTINQTQNHHV